MLRESRGEVDYGASFISWNAEEAKRIEGEVLSSPVPGMRTLLVSQPVGVAALVTPWNFPVAMITRKAGPALAAGCAVVVKPSEETPFSALALAEVQTQIFCNHGRNMLCGLTLFCYFFRFPIAKNDHVRKIVWIDFSPLGGPHFAIISQLTSLPLLAGT